MADNKIVAQQSKIQTVSSVSKSSPPVPKPKSGNHPKLVYNKNEPETSPNNVNYNLTIIKAIEMRAEGIDWKVITTELGYKQVGSVKTKVEAYINEHLDSSIEIYRNVIGTRLEMMSLAIKARADNGDITAINAQLKITDQAAKLYGLNAPDKQLVGHIDLTPENLFELTFGKAIEAQVTE